MYQAHAQQLLNQKDDGDAPYLQNPSGNPLFAATNRLVAALDRLENNLQYVTVQPGGGQQAQQLLFFEQENKALRVERDQLDAAISQLQYQYSDLHKVASAIYGKLDDSIKRLTQLIEN